MGYIPVNKETVVGTSKLLKYPWYFRCCQKYQSLILLDLDESCLVQFFSIKVSNNFPYKPIMLESYRLLPIYTSRIAVSFQS